MSAIDRWRRLAHEPVHVGALQRAVFAWFRRGSPNESQHLFALTLVVGVVCGLVAVAFHLAIRAAEALLIQRAVHAPGTSWMFWTIATPTAGGVLAGLALAFVVPGARGSGIPQVKQAFAKEGGRVRFRDAAGKFVIGAMQVGAGASLGREGPTVQICAGAASALARATALPPRNMRRLLPVGVAAGIAAAFNAPIAAVTFTIEEIVGTLDQTVLSGVVVAAALAAVIERGILGVHPVIEVSETYGLDHASSLALYAALGVAAALVSVAFTDSLLALRAWFQRLRSVPTWAQPAVGGLVTGALAVLVLRLVGTEGVTGGGYETLGRALAGGLGFRVLVTLCLVKIVATVFSYSSGGAGGIFAPALFVGAMLGGAVGYADVALLHHESRQLGAFALVGMGAVFAGVIRAPMTSVLIIFEMTGGYGLVLPLMLANVTAYVLARHWRPMPIYDALLAQDGVTLQHSAPVTRTVERLPVSDAMTRDVVFARADEPVADALARLGARDVSSLPVVDATGKVVGLVRVGDLRGHVGASDGPVGSLTTPCASIQPDTPLFAAIERMNDLSIRQLVVVQGESPPRLAGILALSDVVRAHARVPPGVVARATAPPRAAGAVSPRVTSLMESAIPVARDAKLSEIEAVLSGREQIALVIPDGAERYGVVLSEHVENLDADDDLRRMLVAADLMRPAVTIDAAATLVDAAQAIATTGAECAVVVEPGGSVPVGVVGRTRLALALLDSYASVDAGTDRHSAERPRAATR